MTDEAGPVAAPSEPPEPRPTSHRREWMARALFEGGLIAVSLVGALALNEWQESRDRQARVRDATAAIRLELRANREEIGLGGAMGDLRANPDLMLGLLNELDDHARRLVNEYDAAVKVLSER